MTPKVAITCFVGLGGSTVAYGFYRSSQLEKKTSDNQESDLKSGDVAAKTVIQVEKSTNAQDITKNTATCTKPTHKATISNDDKVEYHICSTITESTVTSTTTTAEVVVETGHTFKQTKHTSATPPKSISTQWTYSQTDKTPSTDFYWLTEDDKNFFFIKTTSTETPPFDLTNNEGITSFVEKIEKLRKAQIITIETLSTTKEIDSISCTTPKLLLNNQTLGVEYYSCATITGGDNTEGDVPVAATEQKIFQPNATFKTKTGTKHKITKWSKNNEDTYYFYWFKPSNTTLEDSTTFFFTKTDTSKVDELKNMVIEIENFYNKQKTHNS